MATTIQISSVNFSGQSANVFFYPATGGTISLGPQVIPFNYTNDYYYGTYDIVLSAQTCQLVISAPVPSPTPSVTPTNTPTVTPTNTPTPSPVVYSALVYSGASVGDACAQLYPTTVYAGTPIPTAGQQIYSDSSLTTFAPLAYYFIPGNDIWLFSWTMFVPDLSFYGVCPSPTPTVTTTPTVTPTPTVTTTPTASPAPPFDPDAQAYFNRVTTAGGSLTVSEQNAVNTMVLSLKSNSLWSKLDAVYPQVGSNANGFSQNLISSSFTGTFNGTWTFNASGATPNGIDAYFDTGWNPSTNSDINNNHYGAYTLQNQTGNKGYGVVGGSISRWFIYVNFSNTTYPEMGDSYVTWSNAGVNLGLTIASSNSGTMTAYNNGSSVGNVSYGGSAPNGTFYFGAIHDIGNPTGGYMNVPFAFQTLGDYLTSGEITTYSSIINTFQTTLGRNTY